MYNPNAFHSRLIFLLIFFSIFACSRKEQPSPSDPPTPVTPKIEYMLLETSSSRLRLSNRIITASILISIFGPTAKAIVLPLIQGQIQEFGGPCDRYMTQGSGSTAIPECQLASARMGVFYPLTAQSQAPVIPQANTGREALRTRACDQLGSDDRAIAFAAKRAGSKEPLEFPQELEIRKAYDLFYSGRPIPAEVLTALTEVVSEAKKIGAPLPPRPIEGWRYLLNTLCLSSDWQIL